MPKQVETNNYKSSKGETFNKRSKPNSDRLNKGPKRDSSSNFSKFKQNTEKYSEKSSSPRKSGKPSWDDRGTATKRIARDSQSKAVPNKSDRTKSVYKEDNRNRFARSPERPSRPYDPNKSERPFSDKPRDDRKPRSASNFSTSARAPYRPRREDGDAPRYKRDDRGGTPRSSDKPFREKPRDDRKPRSASNFSTGVRSPYRSRREDGDAPRYKRDDRGGTPRNSDRPFRERPRDDRKPRSASNFSTGARSPYRPRREDGDAPRYKRDDRGGTPRNSDRPFRERPNDDDRKPRNPARFKGEERPTFRPRNDDRASGARNTDRPQNEKPRDEKPAYRSRREDSDAPRYRRDVQNRAISSFDKGSSFEKPRNSKHYVNERKKEEPKSKSFGKPTKEMRPWKKDFSSKNASEPSEKPRRIRKTAATSKLIRETYAKSPLKSGRATDKNSEEATKPVRKRASENTRINARLNIESRTIWNKLVEANGKFRYTDETPANIIEEVFDMSKKAFKRGLGHLYKLKMVELNAGYVKAVDGAEFK